MFSEYRRNREERKKEIERRQQVLKDYECQKEAFLAKVVSLETPVSQRDVDAYYVKYKNDTDVKKIVDTLLGSNFSRGFNSLVDYLAPGKESMKGIIYISYDSTGIGCEIKVTEGGALSGPSGGYSSYEKCGIAEIQDRAKQKAVATVAIEAIKERIESCCASKGDTVVTIGCRFVPIYHYQEAYYDYISKGIVDDSFKRLWRKKQDEIDNKNKVEFGTEERYARFSTPFIPTIKDGAVLEFSMNYQGKKLREL